MKRKFLEDLGLEKEMVDKIMNENGSDIESAKADHENLKQQFVAQEQQIKERDLQLESLKNSSVDNQALQQRITDLQAENVAAKEKYESDMKEIKLTAAIKLALGDSVQDADLVTGLFDESKLILDEEGAVTGLDEQLSVLKKEKAFLFKEEKATQLQIKGGKPVEGAGIPSVTKKPAEMTYSEMCKYLESNPGAVIE